MKMFPPYGKGEVLAAMYLFDTDSITNILKKKPSILLLKRIKSLDQSQQFVSTITISEIVYGAYKSERPYYHIGNLEKILIPSVNIAVFDTKSSYICGMLRAELERKGQMIAYADLQTASIAMANDFTLITGNTRQFQRISGLKFENWLE